MSFEKNAVSEQEYNPYDICSNFQHHIAAPYDPSVQIYAGGVSWGEMQVPFMYSSWQEETLSWKKTCYLHTFLSGGMADIVIKGPDAEKLMSKICINSFSPEKFKVGRAKHIISCAPNGNISQHGMCLRTALDEFHTYNMEPVLTAHTTLGNWEIEPVVPEYNKDFVFQIAGPTSLQVVENVIQDDIHDLKFMEFCYGKILGHDVRILRMGMGGTLSYEIHGFMKDFDDIYKEVIRVGERFGMVRLGWWAYMCNHTENGFAQHGEHFISDWCADPTVYSYIKGSYIEDLQLHVPLHGSLAKLGQDAYYLNPYQAGWAKMINWDHDFIGKDALREIAKAKDTWQIVTLEWDKHDVLKTIETFLDDEEGVSRYMQFPQNMTENGCGSSAALQDRVEDGNGNVIGKSCGRVYTLYYKKIISMGFIKPEFTKIGTEVTVIWGDEGQRQVPVRARIARFPYLDLVSNQEFDMETIPHFQK